MAREKVPYTFSRAIVFLDGRYRTRTYDLCDVNATL
jgi:hypothetical protein